MLHKFARNYALISGGLVPSFYQLIVAARGAVDDNFAYEVWDRGSDYPWQSEEPGIPGHAVERGRPLSGREADSVSQKAPSLSGGVSCLSRSAKEDREKVPGEWKKSFGGMSICSYPPEDVVIEGYGRHLQKRAMEIKTEENARIVPFESSMLEGIDIRQTIRDWSKGKIYVKEGRPFRGKVGSVVVIFDPDPGEEGRGEHFPWKVTWLGEHEQESDMAFYSTPAGEVMDGPDGLAPGPVHSAFRDQEGTLWFGTGRGLSRFVPGGAEPKRSPPAVFVTGLSVEGAPQALPVAGARKVTLPDLPSGRGQVHISFVSPMAWEADTIRYEYRLEGASGEWSPEASERSVDFANLAPGRYRFSVRAVAADGTRSTVPASVEFGVLAPVWRRGWSLAIAATIAALTAWAGFRYRLRNLLALERVRTRIAADLHDDIGSSLSRIAILSEVVKRQTAEGGAESQRFLTEIAESSRELVDSMGDIVWSIDPRRDNLQHLLARIGHFAESVLGAQGIQWTLDVPSDPDRLRLTPEQRRGVYLVLKEAIANAVRHSGCRTLGIRVTVGPDRLSAEVFDDGTGIPPPPAPRGRGLANMESRALEIGAAIRVSSRPGGGTVVRLDLPIRSKGRTGVLWFGRGGRRKIVDRESEDH